MDVEIRPAREDEIPELIRAYEWLFAPPGARPAFGWDERRAAVALKQAIDSHDSVVLVAIADPDPAAPASGASRRITDRPSGSLAEEAAGGIVGFLTAYQDLHSVRFGYRAWVEDFAVHPDRRSQGIGKRLLDAAKAWARERGASHLELDSALARADAHRFYEREGADHKSFSFGWQL